ncbi:hypothetical protein E2C01_094350 [Portunus trituberculatus]|uniref:Uncharacterized protein n=1 Tax=Portunus trituberculatus TaxID=210409 RepID=A0A5B7JVX0_PORTR|nr:hypothetical protein [Portunus trituberculatus]
MQGVLSNGALNSLGAVANTPGYESADPGSNPPAIGSSPFTLFFCGCLEEPREEYHPGASKVAR